jgi:serine/threonine-protein kinase
VGLALGAAIVQVNYLMSSGDSPNHMAVMGALASWAGLSYVLQHLQARSSLEGIVSYAWAAVDAVLYTALVHLAAGPHDVLVAGYPLLIAASGLWFRVRLVVCMTLVCLAAWLWLSGTGHIDPKVPAHYLWIVSAVLLVTGAAVAFQVYRIRTLNRYFERQVERTSGR